MNHIMLDLETLGSAPGSVVVAIGAVRMDLDAMTLGATYYAVIDPVSAQRCGLTIDAGTVQWWLRQSEAARAAIVSPAEQMPLDAALTDFAAWIGRDAVVWGNGAGFDNVLLRQAYAAAGIACPWSHRNDRCYRTVKALAPHVEMQRVGVHHHAEADAISQADHLVRIMKAMRAGSDTVEIVLADDAARTEVA